MYKLGRREFLKLIGGMGIMSIISLNGCSKYATTEEEKNTMVSYIAMQEYEFLACENNTMLVKYDRLEKNLFTVTQLKIDYDKVNENVIYTCEFTDFNENKEQFYEKYKVLESEDACFVFDGYYGKQDYYTVEAIDYVLRNEKVENKIKKLVK